MAKNVSLLSLEHATSLMDKDGLNSIIIDIKLSDLYSTLFFKFNKQ